MIEAEPSVPGRRQKPTHWRQPNGQSITEFFNKIRQE
jgi:hypothetical protein